MFLRFTTTRIHKDSKTSEGVFAAAYELANSLELEAHERTRLREILIWFNKNLPSPGKGFEKERATFWFKSTASESINRVWELANLLREYGYDVVLHKCSRLANICYEDELQVASYPSDRDGAVTRH